MNDQISNEFGEDTETPETQSLCKQAECGFGAATEYLRANPWVGVASGLILGAAVFALCKPAKPEPTTLERLRDLLDEAYAKLPTKKEAKSAASCLLNKLHIPV